MSNTKHKFNSFTSNQSDGLLTWNLTEFNQIRALLDIVALWNVFGVWLGIKYCNRRNDGKCVSVSHIAVNEKRDRRGGRATEPATSKKTVLQWDQLCSLSPPAGGCAELVAMRKIAPPRIKYHWNTAQHSKQRSLDTAGYTAQCKTRLWDPKRAQTSQAIGHDSGFCGDVSEHLILQLTG